MYEGWIIKQKMEMRFFYYITGPGHSQDEETAETDKKTGKARSDVFTRAVLAITFALQNMEDYV